MALVNRQKARPWGLKGIDFTTAHCVQWAQNAIDALVPSGGFWALLTCPFCFCEEPLAGARHCLRVAEFQMSGFVCAKRVLDSLGLDPDQADLDRLGG